MSAPSLYLPSEDGATIVATIVHSQDGSRSMNRSVCTALLATGLATGLASGLFTLACSRGQDPQAKGDAAAEPAAPASPTDPKNLDGPPRGEDELAKARAAGREPKRVQLAPLVNHQREREQALSGGPAPIIADQVDDGWIVFVSEVSGTPAIHRMRSSAAEREPLTHGELTHFPVAPLPGGDLLAIRVEELAADVHREELLRIRPDGALLPLAAASGRARSPSVAPDGRWMVYESDLESFRDLYRLDLEGGASERLTDNAEGNFEPAISPDGLRIVFASSRDGNAEIYLMNADGSKQRRLTVDERSDTAPSWSPDGSRLAFISARDGSQRIHLLDTKDLDRPGELQPRRLTGDRDLLAEAEVTWSPQGDRVALLGVGDMTTSLWVADIPSGNLRRLTDDGALDQGPCWSPNGEHVAFASNRDGELDIYRVSADGGAPTRLTQSKGADWLPRWIPEASPSPTPAKPAKAATSTAKSARG